jgi:Pyruvate/2-oxoacid:ferredoxin oxidoreductase delta subunit
LDKLAANGTKKHCKNCGFRNECPSSAIAMGNNDSHS